MKALKERMIKIDKICQSIQLSFPEQSKALFKRKKNNSCILKEQDQNLNNQSFQSSNAGCIIHKTQIKKQQSQQKLQIECETVRSQTVSLKQLKMIHEQDQLSSMKQQKEDLQSQIHELVKIKKQIQEKEEKKNKKQLITQDKSLLPQMLKLQQEKVALENEINQIDQKIDSVRYNSNKLQQISKRNLKEEKKSFEQKWMDLELNESKLQSFEDRLLDLYTNEELVEEEQVDQQVIDTLTQEVENLLSLRLPEEQQEISQRSKLNQQYQSPLQIIEEEQSVDLSFQKL